jgi:hypothetical protein
MDENCHYPPLSAAERIERARALWDRADPDIDGTPADQFLRSLGGRPPWPASLHFLHESNDLTPQHLHAIQEV